MRMEFWLSNSVKKARQSRAILMWPNWWFWRRKSRKKVPAKEGENAVSSGQCVVSQVDEYIDVKGSPGAMFSVQRPLWGLPNCLRVKIEPVSSNNLIYLWAIDSFIQVSTMKNHEFNYVYFLNIHQFLRTTFTRSRSYLSFIIANNF